MKIKIIEKWKNDKKLLHIKLDFIADAVNLLKYQAGRDDRVQAALLQSMIHQAEIQQIMFGLMFDSVTEGAYPPRLAELATEIRVLAEMTLVEYTENVEAVSDLETKQAQRQKLKADLPDL